MMHDPQTIAPHSIEDEPDVGPHPEAMVSEVEFSIGDHIHVRARSRFTPASLIAVGIASVAILLALVPVVRAGRRRRD
ncbi:MAG TPA: hypothetical protein VMS78_12375 [Rhizomicrobium sp.]|nr:hypothetical protein [Rhizomicrobium sp.]